MNKLIRIKGEMVSQMVTNILLKKNAEGKSIETIVSLAKKIGCTRPTFRTRRKDHDWKLTEADRIEDIFNALNK